MGIILGLFGGDTWQNPLGLSSMPGLDGQKIQTKAIDTTAAAAKQQPQVPSVDAANQPIVKKTVLPEKDLSTVVDVMLGEAAGEGPEGLAAVASVIKNRADNRKISVLDVVTEPDQFTAYRNPGDGVKKAINDPEMRAKAEEIFTGVLAGKIPDPTGGADHYHTRAVSPSWAKKFKETATIGEHIFYRSSKEPATKPIILENGFQPEDGLGLLNGQNPFDAVLNPASDQESDRPKGLQVLVKDEPAPDLATMSAGTLSFRHKGQDQIAPEFRTLLEATSKDIGKPLSITSGFRSGNHPVERRKRTPGEHSHGTASDIDMRGMNEAQRTALVNSLISHGAKRFITYSNSPDMLHVDMKDQLGNGSLWFMHDKSARNIERAPSWFRKIAAGDRPEPSSALTAYADVPLPERRPAVTSPAPRGEFDGLLEAGNIDLERRPQVKLDDGSIATVHSASFNVDGKEVLLPTVSDDGKLLSNDEALQLYRKTGKHLGIFDTPEHATVYADALHKAQADFFAPADDAAPKSTAIILDENFQPQNGMKLSAADNPFQAEVDQLANSRTAAEAETQQAIADQQIADNAAAADTVFQKLEQESPGRYKVMDEDEAAAFREQWEKDNRSTSIGGDAQRHLAAGNADLGLAMDEAARYIPFVGDKIADGMAAVDEWFTGKPMKQRLAEEAERQRSSTTPEDAAAIQKKAYDPNKPFFIGDALKDPRWYIAQASESVPGMAATMAPGTAMARASYLKALATGLTEREAAARAAKTALLAGSLGEGTLGGAQSSLAIKEKIAAIPRETILQSEAVQGLIKEGMSEDDAVKAVTEDAATQAFIYSGTVTGLFGGMGDRVLTKIIAEGVGGNVAKRVTSAAVREGVAEGAEETIQGGGQQIAENKAMQTVDPKQDLMEGVAEGALSGLAVGGPLGGLLGAPAGLLRQAMPGDREADPAEDAAVDAKTPADIAPADQVAQPAQADIKPNKKGGLAESIEKGRKAAEDAALKRAPSGPDLPPAGSTVLISEDGVEMMGTIDSWENGEAIIMDRSTGEILQVPASAIKEVMHRGGDPIPGTRTSEMPPREETKKATENLTLPDPGKRVIVDAEGVERFPGTVERYEGDDALVRKDDGKTVQVPVADLRVDGLTSEQREAKDLAENPPVEREKPEATPTRRIIANRPVDFPDERHARLYDLAQERLTSRRLLGKGSLDMNNVMPAEQRQLASEFGVTPEALGQMADDYRYRAERAGKQSRSDLPVKFHGVNEQRLKQWQAEAKKASKAAAVPDIETAENSGQNSSEPVVTPSGVSENAGNTSGQETVLEIAANQAATSPQNDLSEPSDAQKEAGNYKLGHVKLGGLDFSIENPAGSTRKGKSRSGKAWETLMRSHYGYIKGTVGKDKDHIDAFIKPGTADLPDTAPVYVVDQRDPARNRFDEHKVMIGWDSQKAARDAYLENYDKNWKGLGAVTATTLGEFKQWLKDGDTTTAFAQKWFGKKEQAETYIANEGLGDRYEVVPEGLKFEVRRKAKAEENAAAADIERPKADSKPTKSNAVEQKDDSGGKGRPAKRRVTGFATSKGSTYAVHEDGTTTRNKAARNDPGHEGDKGQKARTHRTIYTDVNPAVLSAAGLTLSGNRGARVAIRDGKATLVTWNAKANRWGTTDDARDIRFFDEPAMGRYPLELWEPATDVPGYEAFAKMHAGNKIVDIQVEGSSTAPAKPSAPVRKKLTAAERRAAAAQREKDIAEFFTPGEIVPAYGNTRDLVLEYTGDAVRVQEVDKDGKPVGRERVHHTWPDERTLKRTLAERARAKRSQQAENDTLLQPERIDRERTYHTPYDISDFETIAKIVADVAGLEDVEWPGRIRVPGAKAWGIYEAIDAAGQYDTARDVISISRQLGGTSTAFHEAFHRIQNLFLNKKERAVLKAEVGRLRRIVAAKHGWEATRAMHQIELEAEAFALYATADQPPKVHSAVRDAWNRIMEAIRRAMNYLAGRGLLTMEDVFEAAKSGEMKDRTPNPDPALAVGKIYQPAPSVNSPAFKRWFGASKVVDKDGTTHAWTSIPDWVTAVLQNFGYDGIKDTGGKGGGNKHTVWVPFSETQVKSPFNRGTFDPEDSRILYSIPSGRKKSVTENLVIDEVRGKLTDLTPALLGAVPLNYFPELKRPNMTAVDDYMRVKRKMDAYRGTKHAEADELAQEWLKYTRLGPEKAKALSNLMHETTIAGIDPSKTDEETRAKPGYDELRKKFNALPPSGRQLYGKVRDMYKGLAEELDQILLDNVRKAMQIEMDRAEADYRKELERIEKSSLKGTALKQAKDTAEADYKAASTRSQWSMKARLTKLRLAFESSRVEPPYFPLGRFGNYFVAVRDVDGSLLSFSKFEKAADRDRAAAQLRKENKAATVTVGVLEDKQNVREAMDPRLIAEIETILGTAKVNDEVMDQVWQRYLESMPDLSTRKRFIHRSGTAGFHEDALRVFSNHTFHAAHQMAKTKFGMELGELVNTTVDQAQEADDQTKGMTLANELKRRHQWVMNPTGGSLAQLMTSTAFVWMLAASPAAAMVNLSQTVMLGLPVLAGRYGGMTKASAALLKASRDFIGGRGHTANANISADEKQAMAAFYESGLIDRTQSHDLAGVGDTGVKYSPLRSKIMGVISWGFHQTERMNREITALAAYRLARAAGESQSAAIETAHELTYKTHFDFSNSSRPRYMQNDFAKVALVFRSYQINALYRLFRDIHQSLKGESPQARREARYQLAGVLGMQALLAGVTGVAGFHLAMALASMIFGDDDDPMDYETKFKADVLDILGPQLGGMVLNGVPGHYLGIDLTARIGMPDLWFRSPGRELQGREEYQYYLSQLLGAVPSIGERMYYGFTMAADGDVSRGIEMAAPKFAADAMKVYRYATEGLTNLKGDEIVPAEDIDVADLLKQGLGFTPAKISESWDRKSALENAESRVMDKRKRLVNRFALAVAMQDHEARQEAIADIKAFNAGPVNRAMPITKETLQRSIATRARNARKREDGALIESPALSKILRESLPDRVY